MEDSDQLSTGLIELEFISRREGFNLNMKKNFYCRWLKISLTIKMILETRWKFPGGPVVRTQCFHCWGSDLIPGWGTKLLQATAHSQKKKQRDYDLLLVSRPRLSWAERGMLLDQSQSPVLPLSPHPQPPVIPTITLLHCSESATSPSPEHLPAAPPPAQLPEGPGHWAHKSPFDWFHNKPQCSTLPSNPTQQPTYDLSPSWATPKSAPRNAEKKCNLWMSRLGGILEI